METMFGSKILGTAPTPIYQTILPSIMQVTSMLQDLLQEQLIFQMQQIRYL